MRAVFDTLGEFVAELSEQLADIGQPVRFRIHEQPSEAGPAKLDVYVVATAIVGQLGSGAAYLMEHTAWTGNDWPSSSEPDASEGSERAESVRRQLKEACDDLGLRFRSGKWEVF